MTPTISLRTPLTLVGALISALASLSCQASQAATRDAPSLYRYSGKLVAHVEQPDSAADCGEVFTNYDTSGYLTVDRVEQRVRLDGFGCTLRVAEAADSNITAAAQPCEIDGPANFQGVSIEALDFESFSMSADGRSIAWHARAWRNLPDGRFYYCFDVDGAVEPH